MSDHQSVGLATSDQPPLPPLEEDLSVAVIEADRAGAGTTGHTTGKVTSQHGCNGSRFDTCGAVLNGPAVRPIEQVDIHTDT